MPLTWYRKLAARKAQASGRSHRGAARRRRCCRPLLEPLEPRVVPAQHNWTGLDDFAHRGWGAVNNWDSHSAPGGDPEADLVFLNLSDASRRINRDDYPGEIPIRWINFLRTDYTVESDPGSSIQLIDKVLDLGGDRQTTTLHLNMRLTNAVHRFEVADNATLILSGNLSGGGCICKVEAGTLVLSGDNRAYTGELHMLPGSNGTVRLGGPNALSSATSVYLEEGGTLDLNGFDVTLTRLLDPRGNITLGNGNLTLEGGVTDIYGPISGEGGLSLTRGAFVHFIGNQAYHGPTRIYAGTLQIDATSPRSPVTVDRGATLSGRGQAGVLTVSGLVTPGDAPLFGGGIGPGVLRSNDVTFQAGSTFAVRLDGPAPGGRNGYDQLDVTGTVNLSGSPTLFATLGFSARDNDTFTIVQSTGGITGTFAGLPNNAVFGISGKQFRINYTGTSVVLTHLPQFLPPVYYAATAPNSVAVGRFHDPNILDLAVGNDYYGLSATVNVLLGNGDGTFRNLTPPIPIPSSVLSVAVGHFHDPNIDDLAVTTYDHHVYVLLGNGDGTFQDAVPYTVGAYPVSLVVGDLNGNGNQDLVLANQDGGTVSILYGNGDGTFQDAVNLDFPTPIPSAVALADLHGNGRLDLVVGHWSFSLGGVVSVLTNLGNDEFGHAIFSPPDDYRTTTQILSLVLADFNGDGKLDIVTASSGSGGYGLDVLLGNGDGTFQRTVRFSPVGDFLGALVVADFDGDGKLDVAVALSNSARGVAVLYGKEDGYFQPPAFYDLGGGRATWVTAGDFNGDGAPDLAATVYSANVAILINREGRAGSPSQVGGPAAGHSPTLHNFPDASLLVLAGDHVTGTVSATLIPTATSAGLPPSPSVTPLGLDVRHVDRLFALPIQEDSRAAVPAGPSPSLAGLENRMDWEIRSKSWPAEETLPDGLAG